MSVSYRVEIFNVFIISRFERYVLLILQIDFTDLAGQTWNIHAVSALFDLQYDDIHFKLYSKKLREEIASTLSSENVTYDVKFSVMENVVSRPNEDHEDHPAIKVHE